MKQYRLAAFAAAAILATSLSAIAQTGQGRAVVTVLAKHSEVAPSIAQSDVTVKVNGKDSAITAWMPFKGANDGMELILLIDSGARNLGRQFDEIKQFIQGLNPDTKVAIGYMQNGRAAMAGPFSTDRKQVLSGLHLPVGPTTNPYFTISDLSQNWPSHDQNVRREVVMLSDGIDPENRRYDPDDPYVQAAVRDAVRAGIVVYTIYWRSFPEGDNALAVTSGQSLLSQLGDATGGYNYWTGSSNPVSFQPYFTDLTKRFNNQYALVFAAKLDRKPAAETLKVKVEGIGLQVTTPQQVFVHPGPPQ
jgi:hypothetical protein